MKKRKLFGLILIIAGLFLFALNPLANLMGFAIAENISYANGLWIYALGLAMIILGFILVISDISEIIDRAEAEAEREALNETRRIHRLRSKKPIGTEANRKAGYYYREMFIQEKGYVPNEMQLREYIRRPHEKKRIGEGIEEYNSQKKRGFSE